VAAAAGGHGVAEHASGGECEGHAGRDVHPDNNAQCLVSGVGNVSLVDRPPAQDMLAIDQAHQFSTGKNVTVAEIDTGVNPHPFLRTNNRLVNGGDYILGDGNALSDCDGHGTIVAGIIGADTRGTGLAFTAWRRTRRSWRSSTPASSTPHRTRRHPRGR